MLNYFKDRLKPFDKTRTKDEKYQRDEPPVITEQLVKMLYQQILGRPAENPTVVAEYVKNFRTIEALIEQFTHSDEFKSRLADHSNFAQAISHADGILTIRDNIFLLFPSYDRVQAIAALTSKECQGSELKTIFTYLRNKNLLKGDVFFDIGANVGTHTIFAFKEPTIQHAIAVEPGKVNFQFLGFNLKLNNLENKTQFVNSALGDKIGSTKLLVNPINCGDCRLYAINPEATNERNEDNYAIEIAPICTLDNFIQLHSIDIHRIALLWMDTQGSEGVILGPSQQIRQSHCPLYIEFWPYGMRKLNSYPPLREFILTNTKMIVRFIDGEVFEYAPSIIDTIYAEFANNHLFCDLLLIR